TENPRVGSSILSLATITQEASVNAGAFLCPGAMESGRNRSLICCRHRTELVRLQCVEFSEEERRRRYLVLSVDCANCQASD
ncbi:MAG: hypothetical protein PVG21_08570, partial [Gammaproteobacteria bacterium]